MKYTIKFMLLLFATSTVFFSACNKDSVSKDIIPYSSNQIDSETSDGLKVYAVNSDFADEVKDLILSTNKDLSNERIIDVQNVRIEEASTDVLRFQYVLATVIYENESSTNVAFQLKDKINPDSSLKGMSGFITVVSHECKGNPCNCCDFIRNEKGNIIGCTCYTGAGLGTPCHQIAGNCIHTVKSSDEY